MIPLVLIQNIALLISLTMVQQFLMRRFSKSGGTYQLILGAVFGLVSIAGMMTPLQVAPGVIFDGRSILLGVAGFFGGPITATVAAVISGLFRLSLGGAGMYMGLGVIASSACYGVVFHYLRPRYPQVSRPLWLLTFGLLIHVTMLLWTLALPWELALRTLPLIALPVLTIYPLATWLVCLLFLEVEKHETATADLRQKTEELDRYFTSALDLLCIADTQGRFRKLNPEWEKTLGYSVAELEGRYFIDFVHPDDVQATRDATLRLAEQKSVLSFVNRFRHKDGSYRWIEWRSLPREEIVYAAARDITEHKQADETLRESEERFRAVSEYSPNAIFIVNESAKVVWANDKAVALSGHSREQLLASESFLQYIAPDSRDFVIENFQRFQHGTPYEHNYTFHLVRSDGEKRFCEKSMVHIQSAGGRRHLVISLMDLTERRQLEDKLRQAQKMEAVGQLAGGVAHDFNNILAATMMQLCLLQEHPGVNGEMAEMLNDLQAGTKRAADLTRQLLMFSRRSVLEMKLVDLNEVIENLLKMLRRLIGEDINLVFEAQNNLPPVEIDSGMIEQVLMNLSVNARDAMPKGGKLAISTCVVMIDEAHTLDNPDKRPGLFVCLSVTDTGCGMDDTTLKRIFEPFFTTKEPGKGTGLGLATVYGIVAQHKGWVDVSSRLGKGTSFRVFLPASAEKLLPPAPEVQTPIKRGHETILLVEDEPEVRRVGKLLLQQLGYKVLDARTGQDAVNLWKEHSRHIDMLFTDMVMPEGMTGLDLAAKLRLEKPNLKVIISSGYSSEMTRKGLPTEAGITFLPKPYVAETMSKAIRDCLDRK